MFFVRSIILPGILLMLVPIIISRASPCSSSLCHCHAYWC